jgi:hypothetical protein
MATHMSDLALGAKPAHEMEQALRSALRGAAQEDPDLLAAIEEHRNAIPGKKLDSVLIRAGNNPQVEGAQAPVLDRSYFALLQQVSKLESENAALTSELNDAKEDAMAYADVAREMEEDYNTLMSKNEVAERRARAAEEATQDALARLAAAEAAIEALKAQQLVGASTQTWEPSPAPSPKRVPLEFEVISRACKRSTGDELHEEAAFCAHAAELFRNQQMSDLVSRLEADEASHAAPSTAACSVASTVSARRRDMQRESVEYRRAVREQLQHAAAAATFAGVRSEGLFGDAVKSVEVLRGLFTTPWDVLDGEILSEDEEEEDVCLMRRGLWAPPRGLYHEA